MIHAYIHRVLHILPSLSDEVELFERYFLLKFCIWETSLPSTDVTLERLPNKLKNEVNVVVEVILLIRSFLVLDVGPVWDNPCALALRLWWYSLHRPQWANTSQSWLWNTVCSMKYRSTLTQALIGKTFPEDCRKQKISEKK